MLTWTAISHTLSLSPMQSFWTIFAICNGGMFFQEFKDLSTDQISIFCSGMIVMLFAWAF